MQMGVKMAIMGALNSDDGHSVTRALRQIVQGEVPEAAVRVAICALRNTSYSLAQFLEQCASAKDEARREINNSDDILEAWWRIDFVAEAALRETACIHETVLKTCARGYAELDDEGTVIYANAALLEFCPDLIGRSLVEVFLESEQVAEAIGLTTRSGPFRLTLRGHTAEIPVNAEFGPIGSCCERVSHYALIGDIRAYVAAQIAGFQAAPFGIARVDRRRLVQFVNRTGSSEFGDAVNSLVGRPVEELVPESDRDRLRAFIDSMSGRRRGFVDTFDILVPDRGRVPIEVSAVPEFDPQRRRIGALVFFRSLALDRARDQIYKACERYREPEALINTVFDILQGVLPFDQAIFGVYSDSMKYYRMLLTAQQLDGGSTRWHEVHPEFAQWILYEQPWAADLESYFDQFETGPEVRRRPLVERLLADGIKSFIALPVRQDGEVTTVLSLLSRTPGRYGEEEYQMLKSLPVEQALRMAREGYRQRLAQFVRETLQLFAEAKNHRELARIVVRRLAVMFKWDHVSLFKVNHFKKRFELLEQFSSAIDGFVLPTDYRQSFTEGLMGQALRDGTHRVIDDTQSPSRLYPYIQRYERSRSSLCIPIRLDGAISWMLNVEEAETHAFHGTDLEGALTVVAELTHTLDRLFQAHLTENILDLIDQGAVVVDAMGRIRHLNKAAQALLGNNRQDLERRPFIEFATSQYKDVLAERSSTDERHIVLRDVGGELRPVIASLRWPSDDYDHKIWLLTDTAQRDWNVERRYLRETVYDVAQQTRVPLMIAGRLVNRVTRLLINDESRPRIEDIIDKALKQLGKADITYERLIGSLVDKKRNPEEARAPLNLADTLDEILNELPEDDRTTAMCSVRQLCLPSTRRSSSF
jgi:PAS domain-containing protein